MLVTTPPHSLTPWVSETVMIKFKAGPPDSVAMMVTLWLWTCVHTTPGALRDLPKTPHPCKEQSRTHARLSTSASQGAYGWIITLADHVVELPGLTHSSSTILH